MPTDRDILDLWTKRRSWSQEFKNIHESDWLRFWRWYRAYIEEFTDPLDWWRSNEVDPQIFKIIETLLPRHIMAMFSSPEWFNARGRESSDEKYEKKVQSLLLYGIDSMNLFPKAYEALKYLLIMGHLFNKVYWKQEYTKHIRDYIDVKIDPKTGNMYPVIKQSVQKELSYNDPCYEWIPLDRGFPDPSGRERWFIEEIETTVDELYATDKEHQIYRNLDLVEIRAYSKSEKDLSTDVTILQENIPEDFVSIRRDEKNVVKLWQCWGYVPKQYASDEIQWRIHVIADGAILIRDDVIPTPDMRLPTWGTKSIPIPGRLFGESILKYVGPTVDGMNRIQNWRQDEVLLNIWQQYKIGRAAGVTTNQMLFQPGGALYCDDIDQVALLERRPVLPDAYTEAELKRTNSEHTSSATDIHQGVMESERATAREIDVRLQQGSARFQLNSMWLDHTWKKPLLERMFKLYQRYLPPDRVVRIVGEDTQETLNIQDIQTPVDIVIESGIFAFSKEAQKDSITQAMQVAAQDPYAQWTRTGVLLREWYELLGFRNSQKYVKTDEEMAQEMAQAAEAAKQAEQRTKYTERRIDADDSGEFERTFEAEGIESPNPA